MIEEDKETVWKFICGLWRLDIYAIDEVWDIRDDVYACEWVRYD